MSEVESKLRTNNISDIEAFENLMKSISEIHMKRKIRGRTKQGKNGNDLPWKTKEIRKRWSYSQDKKRKLQNTTKEYKKYNSSHKE